MIQNVKSGDKITAEQQNQIIDGVNELMNGSYTVNDFGGVGKMTSLTSYSCMFQVKQQMGFTMTSRPNTYSNTKMKTTWMLFGASLASFKKMVGLPTSGKVWLINSNNHSAEGQVQEEWIKRGGSDQYYDGWVDLQYPQYTPVYAIRCQITKKDTGTPQGDYFVIDSESNQEEIGNNLLQQLGLTSSEYKVNIGLYLIIAEYTVAGTMKGDSGSGPKFRQLTQFHVGALVGGGNGNSYTGDSQLSDLQLCSIVQATLSGDNYFKLFEFDQPYNQVSVDHECHDVLVRESKPSSGSPSGYKSVLKYVKVDDIASNSNSRHFDFKNNQVVNCKIYCGNKWVTCGDYSPSPTGGDIYLNIERTTGSGYVINVSQTPYQELDNRIAIKLWEYSDGKATLDVRPGIIPVFAL